MSAITESVDVLGVLVGSSLAQGDTQGGSDEDVLESLEGCRDGGGFLCQRVLDWTGNEDLADWTSFFIDRPLTIILVLLAAWIGTHIARRGILRFSSHVQQRALAAAPGTLTGAALDFTSRTRIEQRTETLSSVLVSIARVAIWSIALLIVLGELGVNLGPLIAGAGIAGVALGFGAQSLVKDVLTGIFMLAEDQYGVGDTVDLVDSQGMVDGTIERVTLRTTVMRDIYGTVWHVPNGQIVRVGNRSQLWAVALLDIGIAYGQEVDRASRVISDTAHSLYDDPDWSNVILEDPQVLGVQALGAEAVTLRLSVKTEPAEQFAVERELRLRIKQAFDDEGIEIPYAQRTVWVRRDGTLAEPDDLGGPTD